MSFINLLIESIEDDFKKASSKRTSAKTLGEILNRTNDEDTYLSMLQHHASKLTKDDPNRSHQESFGSDYDDTFLRKMVDNTDSPEVLDAIHDIYQEHPDPDFRAALYKHIVNHPHIDTDTFYKVLNHAYQDAEASNSVVVKNSQNETSFVKQPNPHINRVKKLEDVESLVADGKLPHTLDKFIPNIRNPAILNKIYEKTDDHFVKKAIESHPNAPEEAMTNAIINRTSIGQSALEHLSNENVKKVLASNIPMFTEGARAIAKNPNIDKDVVEHMVTKEYPRNQLEFVQNYPKIKDIASLLVDSPDAMIRAEAVNHVTSDEDKLKLLLDTNKLVIRNVEDSHFANDIVLRNKARDMYLNAKRQDLTKDEVEDIMNSPYRHIKNTLLDSQNPHISSHHLDDILTGRETTRQDLINALRHPNVNIHSADKALGRSYDPFLLNIALRNPTLRPLIPKHIHNEEAVKGNPHLTHGQIMTVINDGRYWPDYPHYNAAHLDRLIELGYGHDGLIKHPNLSNESLVKLLQDENFDKSVLEREHLPDDALDVLSKHKAPFTMASVIKRPNFTSEHAENILNTLGEVKSLTVAKKLAASPVMKSKQLTRLLNMYPETKAIIAKHPVVKRLTD